MMTTVVKLCPRAPLRATVAVALLTSALLLSECARARPAQPEIVAPPA